MQLKITQGNIYRAQNAVQSNPQVDAQEEVFSQGTFFCLSKASLMHSSLEKHILQIAHYPTILV